MADACRKPEIPEREESPVRAGLPSLGTTAMQTSFLLSVSFRSVTVYRSREEQTACINAICLCDQNAHSRGPRNDCAAMTGFWREARSSARSSGLVFVFYISANLEMSFGSPDTVAPVGVTPPYGANLNFHNSYFSTNHRRAFFSCVGRAFFFVSAIQKTDASGLPHHLRLGIHAGDCTHRRIRSPNMQ